MYLRGRSKEQGAPFCRRLIAYGNHQIKELTSKLIPGFATRLTRFNPMSRQGFNGFGMHAARWMTPCAPRPVTAMAEMVNQGFRHDRPTGVPRTEYEDLHDLGLH
jgi:hypothetical protein